MITWIIHDFHMKIYQILGGGNKTKNTNPLHFRVKKNSDQKTLKESVGQVKINMQIVIPKTKL